uniref:ATP synthase CFO B' chain subunit II n=1 Tax=Nitzschia alba TaxID=2858 RepID=A0A5C0F2P1_NITAL|nr:ATP synthase CFO B' chain subunit II [Nitzschia alba]QEI59589.1 ATP synthase CFO B' chain subunit II [Nitzschia alba]
MMSGLFDINSTSIIIALEFIFLTIFLEIYLFDPLQNQFFNRYKNILTNIFITSKLTTTLKKFQVNYKIKINKIKKKLLVDRKTLKKFLTIFLIIEFKIFKYYINSLVNSLIKETWYRKNLIYQKFYTILLKIKIEIKKILNT